MLYLPTSSILHREGWRSGLGGVKLYYQSWHPTSALAAKAALVIVHGLGSHSSLFQPLVERLVAENYCVYAFDLRGHGRSEGQRGYINCWDEYRQDLQQFVNWVQWQVGDRPCYLMGHSLCGAIALDYSLQFPDAVDGLILTAPAVSTQGISPLKLKLGRFLSWVYPRFSLNTGLRQRQPPTRDEAVNQAYTQDPLRHNQGTARLSTEFFKTNQQTWQRLPQLELPMLILQGEADLVAPVAMTRRCFGQLEGGNKRLHVYPGGYHDIWNDINRGQVIGDLLAWLGSLAGEAVEPAIAPPPTASLAV
jgi:alpha-beta hydrolase superfamily lysophospholipase